MKNPIVTIKMENAKEIKVELYPQVAPNTVKNFVNLVKSGFYDNTIFHRVIPGFMIQGGDPEANGMDGFGKNIFGEFKINGFNNDLKHTRGVISMARAYDLNSASSQFFIMVDDAPHLDGSYASFGKVISGIDEVDFIVNQATNSRNKPIKPQRMIKVTVETFGEEYPEPDLIYYSDIK